MTTAVSQEQQIKWADAIKDFCADVFKKYPTLSGDFIPVLLDEIEALGLKGPFISMRSLQACFRNACADGRIQLPSSDPVLTPEQIDRLRAKFPPIIKRVERELTQREKNANSGVEINNGRKNHSEEEEPSQTGMSHAMDAIKLTQLKSEYKARLSEAESAVGDNPRNHAEKNRLRKSLKDALAADKRFDPVR